MSGTTRATEGEQSILYCRRLFRNLLKPSFPGELQFVWRDVRYTLQRRKSNNWRGSHVVPTAILPHSKTVSVSAVAIGLPRSPSLWECL